MFVFSVLTTFGCWAVGRTQLLFLAMLTSRCPLHLLLMGRLRLWVVSVQLVLFVFLC